MVDHLHQSRAGRVVLITECSMSDNVAVEFPEIEFIRPCNLCPHMKQITLPKILDSLRNLTHQIEIDPAIAARARLAVERMVAIGRRD
jgi:quinolinate synthase